MTSKQIWVTFQRKGLHRYPAASSAASLSDVKYLGDVHRHLFKFKVAISVEHNDREIEFHQFLNWLESLYDQNMLQLDYKSCEMLADDLYEKIAVKYPGRGIIIEISEDGECGVTCTYYT